jgi:hypothetical protein
VNIRDRELTVEPQACRRFDILDGVILIATSAIGVGILQAVLPIMFEGNESLFGVLVFGLFLVAPAVALWTLAMLAFRLRRPRPHLRSLERQPGYMACLSASTGLILSLSVFVGFLYLSRKNSAESLTYEDYDKLYLSFTIVGLLVALVWIVLKRRGRWQPERGWIDRWGRVLGWYWILYFGVFLTQILAFTLMFGAPWNLW